MQRKYDVTLSGRPWIGAEAHERHSELSFKPELIDGWLYLTEDKRLTMLAALLEHCGAAAAVRIGDLEVWREAVRAVDLYRRQDLATESGCVMGRDILESMPFNDDPALGEIAVVPLPNPKLDSND